MCKCDADINIKVKYFDAKMEELIQTEKGDWVDLRVCKAYKTPVNNEKNVKFQFTRTQDDFQDGRLFYNEGDVIIMKLGVAMQLPPNKKANIYPRSSTFPTWGLLLTNAVGCIDNKYQGDADEWMAVFYATRSGSITKYDRVCQFDVVDRQKMIFDNVEYLDGENRSGYGSSGNQ